MSKCAECRRTICLEGEARSARHIGGGSYKRAPRSYNSTICIDCVLDLVSEVYGNHRTECHSSVGGLHWSPSRILDAYRACQAFDGETEMFTNALKRLKAKYQKHKNDVAADPDHTLWWKMKLEWYVDFFVERPKFSAPDRLPVSMELV